MSTTITHVAGETLKWIFALFVVLPILLFAGVVVVFMLADLPSVLLDLPGALWGDLWLRIAAGCFGVLFVWGLIISERERHAS